MYPITDDKTEPKTEVETRNVNWRIMAGPDGKLPGEQITHALLMDVREALRSIRKMMIFFTVLVVIGLIVETLAVMAR
jgi:Na+/serine symporter